MVKSLPEDKIKELHPVIFKKVFGFNSRNLPAVMLIVGTEEDPRSYLAGYWQNTNTFYIQDSGVLPEYRLRGNIRHFQAGLNWFEPHIGIVTITLNKNIVAMRMLLLMGFIPIGGRIGHDNKFYIEWRKERHHDY